MSQILQYIGSIALLVIGLFAFAIIIHFVQSWRQRKKGSNEPPPEE